MDVGGSFCGRLLALPILDLDLVPSLWKDGKVRSRLTTPLPSLSHKDNTCSTLISRHFNKHCSFISPQTNPNQLQHRHNVCPSPRLPNSTQRQRYAHSRSWHLRPRGQQAPIAPLSAHVRWSSDSGGCLGIRSDSWSGRCQCCRGRSQGMRSSWYMHGIRSRIDSVIDRNGGGIDVLRTVTQHSSNRLTKLWDMTVIKAWE